MKREDEAAAGMLGEEQAASAEEGERAESLAAGYLLEKGYKIRERNYKPGRIPGEVDLIVEKEEALVFVEVRYRRWSGFGSPEESVTPKKRRKLVLAALEYVARHREHRRLIRFDVISIVETRRGPRLEHYQGAFDADSAGGGDYSIAL